MTSHFIKTKEPRPGTIRYALAGAAFAIFAFLMIRPICMWMVWGGTMLERIFQ